jgi:hypothetical protein
MGSTTIPVDCTGNYRTRNQKLTTSAPVAPGTSFETINQHAAKNEPTRAVAKPPDKNHALSPVVQATKNCSEFPEIVLVPAALSLALFRPAL